MRTVTPRKLWFLAAAVVVLWAALLILTPSRHNATSYIASAVTGIVVALAFYLTAARDESDASRPCGCAIYLGHRNGVSKRWAS